MAFVAPFAPDPIEFAVGAFVPWLAPRIVGTPQVARRLCVLPAPAVAAGLYARVLVSIGLFGFPVVVNWLDTRAAAAPNLEARRRQARAAMNNPLLK